MNGFMEKIMTRSTLLFGFLVCLAGNSYAQVLTGTKSSIESQLGESLLPSFGKVGLILVLVIGGIYLTLTVLKKMMGRKVSSGSEGSVLELIETCYLSPKKSLSYVRIGNKSALLAVTETSISSVMELDSGETSEALAMIKKQSSGISFTESLSKATRKIVDLRTKRAERRQEFASQALVPNHSQLLHQEAQKS
ncbi:flagellar biosynthetic protein FliO [Gemmatimonas aurantiaca]|nr:flagellar biosynthetic protein FliO [Gemmatimonas aurantiaca]